MVSAAILPFWKCGVATVIDDIRVSLQEQGHTIGMFALDINNLQDSFVIEKEAQCWLTAATVSEKCAYVSDENRSVMHVCDRFAECLSAFKPDVVHFHTPQYFSLKLIKQAKLAGARTIVTLHDWWWVCPAQFFSPKTGERCQQVSQSACLACMKKTKEGEREYALRKNAMSQVETYIDCFTCVSLIVYDDLIRLKPHLKDKSFVIPNPVPDRAKCIRKADGPLTFAFLGGQHDIKGYPQVIEAFSKIEPTGEWRLNIYGCTVAKMADVKGNLKSYILKGVRHIVHPIRFIQKVGRIVFGMMTEKKQDSAIYHFPAFPKEEKQEVLSNTQVVLVCSQVQESFSLVAYEAMANGCCVISTPCGGPTAIVDNGKNGILLQSCDSKAIEKAVRFMIDHREKVEEYRECAFELAKGFMNKTDVGQMYSKLYIKE